jgi:hypothetical protein
MYLIRLNRPIEALHSGAVVLLLRGELYHTIQRAERSNRQIREIIDLTMRCGSRKLSKQAMKNLADISNMYFDAFADLCIVCGIDSAEFAADRDFVDKVLVQRRHQIAHGSFLKVGIDDFEVASDRVIELARHFRNRLESVFISVAEGEPGAA